MIGLRKIYRLNYGVEPRVPGRLNWFLKPIIYRKPELVKKLGLHFATNERLVENYFVLNAIPLSPRKRILDVGCCHSVLPFVLASSGHEVTGVDVFEVEWEHPNFSHVALPLGEAKRKLAGKFDFVLCISTFEHVGIAPPSEDEPARFAADLASLVERNGKVLLTSPWTEKTTLLPGFEKRYSLHDFKNIFDEAGLQISYHKILMDTHLFTLEKN